MYYVLHVYAIHVTTRCSTYIALYSLCHMYVHDVYVLNMFMFTIVFIAPHHTMYIYYTYTIPLYYTSIYYNISV